ncbi:MAG: cytochrome c3 family protein [Desulfomonile tiedjei]|uniref:Cytochrome c3 family protein n=1 Tax=Desulfomonile tiedjei TaxID=2358 RepID=A0A9D6VAV9_9BACT|nr:cytochrome c3 family protein [Desulfomonile tiedjei]
MHRLNTKMLMILMALSFVLFSGGMARLCGETVGFPNSSAAGRLPIVIAHQGSAPSLERPPVAFDHDRHTAALKQNKGEDCGVCHVLKESSQLLANPEVKVFKFPKGPFDATDKTATMYAYHQECVSCHRNMARDGKKTGPDIGLCGKCHVRKPEAKAAAWAWSPLFNYLRHSKHVQAAQTLNPTDEVSAANRVEVVGEVTGKKCEVCHHTYDKVRKKLIYKKDSENSCRSCHKAKDEKDARSMRNVAHSACIGCHSKLAEKVKKELIQQGRTELADQDRKRFGPIECKGCHGEHKELVPEEIGKIPRLVRGQKDVIDLALEPVSDVSAQVTQPVSAKDTPLSRMKTVPYNHKAHEPRAQFCNSCHHYSLEKCSNCHTPRGDVNKGGGVSFERAFHKATARQACVGCHNVAKQDTKCLGCHKVGNEDAPKSSCLVCHRGPSEGKPIDAAPFPLLFDKEKVPEKLLIKTLEKEFKPADFPHQKIMAKLSRISNESSLARVFHSALGENALCSGCHHKTDPSAAQAKKVPTCTSCHSQPFDPRELGKPGILAAYHRQCIGCHESMKQKPAALECAKCHQEKEGPKIAGATTMGVPKGH